jgi:drug/metabolite transporter (DMT)-like permease
LILGEHITSNLLLALLLIVLGIVVVNIKTRRHTPTFSPRNI